MPDQTRLLVVDDDADIRELLSAYLARYDMTVETAADGAGLFEKLDHAHFDLIILDIMLPGEDGLSLCRRLRGTSAIPVIFLTSLDSSTDRVVGLELGADDYVVKPFSPRELMLRISAIMKRGPLLDSMRQQSIEQDGIYIDLIARRVTVDGTQVGLTPKEFDVLALLAANPDVVFSRKKILDTVWGGDLPEDTRTLDTHIKQIRRAITPHNDRIVTLRGVGYRFEKK